MSQLVKQCFIQLEEISQQRAPRPDHAAIYVLPAPPPPPTPTPTTCAIWLNDMLHQDFTSKTVIYLGELSEQKASSCVLLGPEKTLFVYLYVKADVIEDFLRVFVC